MTIEGETVQIRTFHGSGVHWTIVARYFGIRAAHRAREERPPLSLDQLVYITVPLVRFQRPGAVANRTIVL